MSGTISFHHRSGGGGGGTAAPRASPPRAAAAAAQSTVGAAVPGGGGRGRGRGRDRDQRRAAAAGWGLVLPSGPRTARRTLMAASASAASALLLLLAAAAGRGGQPPLLRLPTTSPPRHQPRQQLQGQNREQRQNWESQQQQQQQVRAAGVAAAPLPLLPQPGRKARHRPHTCGEDVDFLRYVRKRQKNWSGGVGNRGSVGGDNSYGSYLQRHRLWADVVNNKWGGHLFARANGVRVPEILACSTGGPGGLDAWAAASSAAAAADGAAADGASATAAGAPRPPENGFVVKVLEGHSAHGVWVLESGFGGVELIRKRPNVTWSEIRTEMTTMAPAAGGGPDPSTEDVYVEERISGELPRQPPFDYKFLTFNGTIGAVFIVANRGTGTECRLWVDESFDRLDQYGCFQHATEKQKKWERAKMRRRRKQQQQQQRQQCAAPVDMQAKSRRKPLALCGDYAKPEAWPRLIDTARKLSRQLGVFMRIDLFVDGTSGEVVFGEATRFPMGGYFHCVARRDPERPECVDPCLLGRLWRDGSRGTGAEEGGPVVPSPEYFGRWENLTNADLCRGVMEGRQQR